ncbi:MAG TPA: UDP-N-acetylglucosamine 1-carboxyvinyltransferase [Ferrovibrio sp.]|uniref:UDP-N-acetylglucosamine 1-carboxyvinyltransferase n=1 Tax=Ferrovibrio sp. TaxID=1917215 RepID=UPI002B4AE36F|nr:UDP-N-acetylglucosamine 1-carboxyvinyltransferase [Ferrovibrio sp.]HLT78208.1 UDP-N-acetylglucosamine 1-carboxyvinyltransferase [Ferrovibrio sp.]
MDRIRLRGGRPLEGSIPIGGAKNAALPLMAAALLTDRTLTLSNVPHLADIATMAHLLQQHGVDVSMDGGNGTPEGRTIHLNAAKITSTVAPYDIVRKMRASVLVLGPLLARFGEAEVSLPGGCAIGTRPVDLHIMGMKALGAEVNVEGGYIRATAKQGLKGAVIRFPMVSVGATENLLMAAALAEGTTVLENAAREPEITDLCHCLVAMGAEIEGIGTEHITVHGKRSLHGASHRIVPDRIETGTFATAAAICGGRVELTGTRLDLIESVADKLREAGCEIEETPRGISIARNGSRLRGVDFLTQPYPGFPTDMQAQVMALMTVSDGASMITETIFENRFMHVPELARMGANIVVHGASALVRGVPKLTGAPVMATDLRASVSLVLAGLAAEGETIVNRVYHLDRGYERLEEKLAACGAVIERLKE